MKKALEPITIPATIAGLLAAVAITTGPAPVAAEPPDHPPVEVTHGRFETLPGGTDLGYDIRGGAIMFRTDADGGTTTVRLRVRGLEPDQEYKVHVHNASCSSSPPGGGHYQDEIDGDVDSVNEIWPGFTTDSKGRGVSEAVHGRRARADAQAIVIHWPENSAVRLACLDLE